MMIMGNTNESGLKDVLTLLSVFLGIVGLLFGLFQYYKAQKWKKSEFAAGLLEQLSSSPDLALCCIFLDWKARRIAVPEKYKVFTEDTSFVHRWEDLTKALSSDEEEANFVFPLVLYRDVFDQFFTYLDRISHYINIGLFDVKDVQSLAYWLKQLKNSRYAVKDGTTGEIINPFFKFINAYDYQGTKNLLGMPEATKLSKKFDEVLSSAER